MQRCELHDAITVTTRCAVMQVDVAEKRGQKRRCTICDCSALGEGSSVQTDSQNAAAGRATGLQIFLHNDRRPEIDVNLISCSKLRTPGVHKLMMGAQQCQ